MNKMLLDIPTRFETERLIIRRYEAGDGPMYYAVGIRNRDHLQRYESGNVILTAKTEQEAEILARELHADWVARNCFFMGAFDKETREFVAQVYVGVVNWDLPDWKQMRRTRAAVARPSDVDLFRRGNCGTQRGATRMGRLAATCFMDC